MDQDASRPRRRPRCVSRGPSSPANGTYSSPLFGHVYCGYGRPSQLLLSSCANGRPKTARFCLAARVMETISTNNVSVRGVTLVDDKLFVLLQRDASQVAVYSTNDYHLLRHIHLLQFNPDIHSDLTSCVRHKCLYMSDSRYRWIYRHDLVASATNKWDVPTATPMGLSVTPNCNLLVTCQWPNKLVELSAVSGQCVREITLQSDIERPWHGVQLTNGQYVVCHGSYNSLHRVCIVDGDGRVIRSHGDQIGSDADQLNMPSHVAVDKDSQFIFVADCFNARVTLLNGTLEFAGLCKPHKSSSRPCRLHLDHATRRLYVGQFFGTVTVIQL